MPKRKFHENPPMGVAVIRADWQADMKKRVVTLRDCFAKAPKMGNDRERVTVTAMRAGWKKGQEKA
jgi:hypothetical protein